MLNIKFRYVVRFTDRIKTKDGFEKMSPVIHTRVFTLDEISANAVDEWLRVDLIGAGYGVVSVILTDMFTGVYDSNDNEIYENDIVEYEYRDETGIVAWDDDDALFYVGGNNNWSHLFTEKRRWHRLTVVGNVHEELVQ